MALGIVRASLLNPLNQGTAPLNESLPGYPEWLRRLLEWPTMDEPLTFTYRRWTSGDYVENRLLPMPLKYTWPWENRRLPMPLEYA